VEYIVLARKSYARNLQYRVAHIISTLGSAVFGFVMVAVWQGAAGSAGGVGEYTVRDLVLWVTFAQTVFNFFETDAGLNIQSAVRSGNVSTELLRPVDFFTYVMSREAGQQFYRLIYRCIPIYVIYAVTVGYHVPSLQSIPWLFVSVSLSLYVGLCINYLVGIASFWTTDIRWAHAAHWTLLNSVSGLAVPADLLPGVLGRVAPCLPWAVLAHWPCRIYLGLSGVEGLLWPVFWAAALTILCRFLTSAARAKLEVQGG
jgi:ABC-2 type transport system permease protein